MKTRIISALIGLPLLFFVVLTGGNVLLVTSLLLSIVGQFEFYRAFRHIKVHAIYSVGYVFTLFYYVTLYFDLGMDVSRFLLFAMMVSLLAVNVFSKEYNTIDVLVTMGGFLYVTFFLSHIYLLTTVDKTFFIWYIFILAWVTDTCAYFTGYFFGKHKLIPEVSPKKTVEGAIGGIVGTTLVTVAYAFIFNKDFLQFSLFLGLAGGVLSQVGDLIASKIKRYTGVKDFGNLMPGHGGVLDRFDSILITAPLVYYFAVLYLNLPAIYLIK